MLQAELYEELDIHNLGVISCSQEQLKERLQELEVKLNLNKDTLIIQVCKDGYIIYYSKKDISAKHELIQIDPALKFRVELDIFELRQMMLCVDKATLKYPFNVITDKYCMVRYMDLSDDFLILDVYMGVAEIESGN